MREGPESTSAGGVISYYLSRKVIQNDLFPQNWWIISPIPKKVVVVFFWGGGLDFHAPQGSALLTNRCIMACWKGGGVV